MFKIIVKDLVLYGYHGVLEKEKKDGQNFLFNIEAVISEDFIKEGDNLKNTVNYSEIIKTVKAVNNDKIYDLLETLASQTADKLMETFDLITEVKIKVEKPKPPIDEKLSTVGVSFKKIRKDEVVLKSLKKKDSLLKNIKADSTDLKTCYLSLGTNTGNRLDNIETAIKKIADTGEFNFLKASSVYETSPMYFFNQENFFNIVLKTSVNKKTPPFVLLGFIKNIEYEMGRQKSDLRNGPRIIDIDIVSIENVNIDSDILTIPHKKMNERNFVLLPLSEIEPGYKIEGKIIKDYIKDRNFKDEVLKLDLKLI